MAVICGVLLACANFVKLMVVDRWLMQNPDLTIPVALVICLTLICTVFCAKVVGCMLPLLAEKVGLDPAVMASPFISTIVDVLSLLIYFAFGRPPAGAVGRTFAIAISRLPRYDIGVESFRRRRLYHA